MQVEQQTMADFMLRQELDYVDISRNLATSQRPPSTDCLQQSEKPVRRRRNEYHQTRKSGGSLDLPVGRAKSGGNQRVSSDGIWVILFINITSKKKMEIFKKKKNKQTNKTKQNKIIFYKF